MVNLTLVESRTVFKRSIYTFLDWLGDIGGLLDALRLIGNIIMTGYILIIGNPLSFYLVNSLFKRERQERYNSSLTDFDNIKSRQTFSMKFCTIFRTKKEKKLARKGYDRVNKMLEVDHLLKIKMQV